MIIAQIEMIIAQRSKRILSAEMQLITPYGEGQGGKGGCIC